MAAEQSRGQDNTDGITAVLAWVGVYLSLIGLVIQVTLTSRIHRLLGDVRIAGDRRRVEGRRGDECQHCAGHRVERDDRTGRAPQLGRREVLEPPVNGKGQVARSGLPGEDVAHEVADRVGIGLPDQQILEGLQRAVERVLQFDPGLTGQTVPELGLLALGGLLRVHGRVVRRCRSRRGAPGRPRSTRTAP